MNRSRLAFLGIALLALSLVGCLKVEYDYKALGFADIAEMESAFAKGYHTKQKLSEMVKSSDADVAKKNQNNDQSLKTKTNIGQGWYVELAGFGSSEEAKTRVLELARELNAQNITHGFGIKTKDDTFSVIGEKSFNSKDKAEIAANNIESLFATRNIRLDASTIHSSKIKELL